MARKTEQISAERLCDAATAALRAAAEVGEQLGGLWPYPMDLYDTPLAPEYLKQFTAHEVDEASKFLVRLGAIEPPTRRRAA